MRRRFDAAVAVLLPLLLGACTANLSRIQDPPLAVAVTTPEHTRSRIYRARTADGVIVIDLGWIGAEETLRRGLARLGADSADVIAVFLTHAHRDHVAGWRAVRGAQFILAEPEVPLLEGADDHSDGPSRLAARVLGRVGPAPGEVRVHAFTRDTSFVFGADTLRAFRVPGHTQGSAAYLFRGTLFVGDAMSARWSGRLTPPKRIYTADPAQGAASIASLWRRLEPYRVRWVCTAHAKCAAYDEGFRERAMR
ncbi:hypothetical protein BH20GEM2_BH20GEM2_21280 [soil metagenome]